MSELTDLLVNQTDPVSALLLLVIGYYTRKIDNDLTRELALVRERVERMEDTYIPDGGVDPVEADD